VKKLSGERKVYAAILGLGLLGLVADRAFFQPQGAKAGDTPSGDNLPVKHDDKTDAARRAKADVPQKTSLSARMREAMPALDFGQVPDTRDAFDPSRSREEGSPRGSSQAELFRQSHKLSSIVTTDKGGCALVDGMAIRVGQTLNEFTLVSVDDEGAHFERNGEQVTLKRPRKAIKDSPVR